MGEVIELMRAEEDAPQPETTQLQQEYEMAPLTFQEVWRFHGKYIDEIEAFENQLTEFWEQEDAENKRQTFYRRMEESIYSAEEIPVGTQLHKLGSVALAVASRELLDAKHEFLDQKKQLDQDGEALSRAFVKHMQERAPDETQASLNGTIYEWGEEVITTRFKEEGQQVTIINAFCSYELSRRYCEQYLVQNSIKDTKLKMRMIAPKEWQLLMDNLRIVALFRPQTEEESSDTLL